MKALVAVFVSVASVVAAADISFPKPGDIENQTFTALSESNATHGCSLAKAKANAWLNSKKPSPYIPDGQIKEVYAEPSFGDCTCSVQTSPGGQSNIPPPSTLYTCIVDAQVRWKLR